MKIRKSTVIRWTLSVNQECEFVEPSEEIVNIFVPTDANDKPVKISFFSPAAGMDVFHFHFRADGADERRLKPLLSLSSEFNRLVFQTEVVHSGSSQYRDMRSARIFSISRGFDLFRSGASMETMLSVDAALDYKSSVVTIDHDVLFTLVGSDAGKSLIDCLGLDGPESAEVQRIPLAVSCHLKRPLPNRTGPVGNLYMQARILDYLSGLVDFALAEKVTRPTGYRASSRAKALHDYLIQIDGPIPTLETLAKEFNRSSRSLNEDFSREFGMPIHAFMMEHRMRRAHEAIENTNAPLKVISANLGYSHVNHFNAAFRRKFGYPPGSLRKSGKP